MPQCASVRVCVYVCVWLLLLAFPMLFFSFLLQSSTEEHKHLCLSHGAMQELHVRLSFAWFMTFPSQVIIWSAP